MAVRRWTYASLFATYTDYDGTEEVVEITIRYYYTEIPTAEYVRATGETRWHWRVHSVEPPWRWAWAEQHLALNPAVVDDWMAKRPWRPNEPGKSLPVVPKRAFWRGGPYRERRSNKK